MPNLKLGSGNPLTGSTVQACGRSMLLRATLFRLVARGVAPDAVHRSLSSRLTRWVSPHSAKP